MIHLIAFLRSLKLSLVEWASVSVALLVGGLVAALKLQGKALHKAQVDLLDVRLQVRRGKADQEATDALAAYDRAKAAYLKGGGKLVLILALTMSLLASTQAQATCEPCANTVTCEQTLTLCDRAVEKLKAQVKEYREEADAWKKQANMPPPGPSFLTMVGVGGFTGLATGIAADPKNGALVGTVSGIATGLVFGLLVH